MEKFSNIQLDLSELTKVTRISTVLSSKLKKALVEFLKYNSDVFSWSYKDMPGIDSEVMVHRLNVYPSFRPIKQKRRTFNLERYKAIKTKVEKLLKADFIKEVLYPTWLANVLLDKKSNGE